MRGWLKILFAYWLTMFAAGAFVAGLLIGLQGLMAALLPWRVFLRVSPVLQVSLFFVVVGGYLMQPIIFATDDLAAAQSGSWLAGSPSYWFLGLFQTLIGSPGMPVLAARAWTGLLLAVTVAGFAYGVSYVRTVREIAEEPDIAASAALPRVPLTPFTGRGPSRAIADFSLRTLVRSSQPRVVMSFYWGVGLAFAIAFIKTPRGQQLGTASDAGVWSATSVPLLVASILMLGASIFAARNAFAMPRDLQANWIFRMVPSPNDRDYATGRWRAMMAVTVVPVCAMAAALCFPIWPWQAALGHLIALAMLGGLLIEAVDNGSRRIPFACSYLPGRSRFHIVLVVIVVVIIPLVIAAATFERDALQDPLRYGAMACVLAAGWLLARWRRNVAQPEFNDEPADRLVTLELWDSRTPLPASERPVS